MMAALYCISLFKILVLTPDFLINSVNFTKTLQIAAQKYYKMKTQYKFNHNHNHILYAFIYNYITKVALVTKYVEK